MRRLWESLLADSHRKAEQQLPFWSMIMATQLNGAVSNGLDDTSKGTLLQFPSASGALRLVVQFFRNLAEAYAWAKEMDRKARITFPHLSNED